MTLSLEDAQPVVNSVASNLAYNWPGIEQDDIAQEINLFLVSRWHNIATREMSDADLKRAIRGLAEREGYSYCVRERYFFQAHTSEWIYTPKEIRSVLPEYFQNPDMRLDAPKRPEHGNQTLTGDGLSIVAMDIKAAFEQLSEAEQVIIWRAYRDNERLYVNDEKRLQRAVDRLTSILNRGVSDAFNHSDHDGPGSRQVMSNAQAHAATNNLY